MSRLNTVQAVGKGSPILGSVVAWSAKNISVAADKLAAIGKRHGLEPRDKSWNAAYSQGYGKVYEAHEKNGDEISCDELDVDAQNIATWQIDRRKETSIDGRKDAIERDYRCFIQIDYTSGKATSKRDPKLAAELEKAAAEAKELRNTTDVTKMLEKLFEGIDLIPLRDQGGAYFVFAADKAAIDRAAAFIADVAKTLDKRLSFDCDDRADCRFLQFDFPATPSNQQSASEAWTTFVQSKLAEYQDAINDFDPESTKPATMEAMARRITELRGRIEAHVGVMLTRADDVNKAMAAAKSKLMDKIRATDAAAARKSKASKSKKAS